MRRSLRVRLALTHAAVAVIAIVVVGLVVNLSLTRRFDSYVAQQRTAREQAVVRTIEQTYTPGIGWNAEAIFAIGHAAAMNGVGVRVIDLNGTVLFSAGSQRMLGMMSGGHMFGNPLGAGGATGVGGASASQTESSTGAAKLTVRTYPVVVDGTTVARAQVVERLGVVLPQDAAYRRALTLYLLLAALLAGGIAVVVSVVVSRRITHPLVALTEAAEQLEQGRLETRVVAHGDDEVAELARAFNRMAEALARQEEWRSTMTADLAHELRTPLATMQARVEALEDGVLPATPDNLRVIGAEVERLGRLLGQLRSLAEVSNEGFNLERREVDLASIVRDAAAVEEPAFVDKGVTLAVSAQAVAVAGDRDRLRQVVTNLLDNALKFTPPGGHAWVEVARDGAEAVLTVSDDGANIDPDDLPFIFERFYRGATGKGAPGVGLGLAIVRGLVRAHGGSVQAAPRQGGGATFTVRLPALPPRESGSKSGGNGRIQ